MTAPDPVYPCVLSDASTVERGVGTLANIKRLLARSILEVYGHDSPYERSVYELQDDNDIPTMYYCSEERMVEVSTDSVITLMRRLYQDEIDAQVKEYPGDAENKQLLRRLYFRYGRDFARLIASCIDEDDRWNYERLHSIWVSADQLTLASLLKSVNDVRNCVHQCYPPWRIVSTFFDRPEFETVLSLVSEYCNMSSLQAEAAAKNNRKALEILLKHYRLYPTTISVAIANQSITLAKWMIKRNNYDILNHELFKWVCFNAGRFNEEMALYLAGISQINRRNAIKGAIYSGNRRLTQCLLDKYIYKLDGSFYCTTSIENYDWLESIGCPSSSRAFYHKNIDLDTARALLARSVDTTDVVSTLFGQCFNEWDVENICEDGWSTQDTRAVRILIAAGVPYDLKDLERRAFSKVQKELVADLKSSASAVLTSSQERLCAELLAGAADATRRLREELAVASA